MIDLFRPYMAKTAGEYVAKVLSPDAHGRVYCGEGPMVARFEDEFASMVGSADNKPLALNSCTSALELALILAGVDSESDVISTPMTCTATNGAILRLGARIVWADVDPITGLIDPADVQRKVSRRTKAIMAVDWAGRSCDYRALQAIKPASAWLDKLTVIQDAAHNLLVDMDNRGDYVCWSFQAIKHLTTGDGGALLVPESMRERARKLRWYGLDRESSADFRCSQDIEEVGFKMHMNDIAAAIGLTNLPYAPYVVSSHQQNAAWYARMLHRAPGVTLPPADTRSGWWLYTLLVDDRAGFIRHMDAQGIAASPVHRRNDEHSAFRRKAWTMGPLPGVEHFASREVAIPVGWWITNQERERVAAAVWEWAGAAERATELAGAV